MKAAFSHGGVAVCGRIKDDEIVPAKSSQIAYELLKEQGANVELLIYNGKHKIGLNYIKKMSSIINYDQ